MTDTPLVIVCSTDAVLGRVLGHNLEKRGFAVHQLNWEPCYQPLPPDMPAEPHLIIADLDCQLANRWRVVTRLRELFPSVPVVLLDYDRPDAGRLEEWRPYRFVHKPLGLRDLLGALDELTLPAAVR